MREFSSDRSFACRRGDASGIAFFAETARKEPVLCKRFRKKLFDRSEELFYQKHTWYVKKNFCFLQVFAFRLRIDSCHEPQP